MPELIIRTASEDDAAALVETCWPNRDEDIARMFIERCRVQIMDKGRGQPLVAVYHDLPIGFGLLTKWSNIGEISDLVVSPGKRGQGVGTALIHVLINVAKSMGLDTVEIGVAQNNEKAYRLYRQLGFEYDRTVNLDLGDGEGIESVDYLRQRI